MVAFVITSLKNFFKIYPGIDYFIIMTLALVGLNAYNPKPLVLIVKRLQS